MANPRRNAHCKRMPTMACACKTIGCACTTNQACSSSYNTMHVRQRRPGARTLDRSARGSVYQQVRANSEKCSCWDRTRRNSLFVLKSAPCSRTWLLRDGAVKDEPADVTRPRRQWGPSVRGARFFTCDTAHISFRTAQTIVLCQRRRTRRALDSCDI